jgi:hypothetical protein
VSGTGPTHWQNAVILLAMNDEWKEDLRCPECDKTGTASLSQDDGADTPTVLSVPDGFKVISTQYGPGFHCSSCNIAVAP